MNTETPNTQRRSVIGAALWTTPVFAVGTVAPAQAANSGTILYTLSNPFSGATGNPATLGVQVQNADTNAPVSGVTVTATILTAGFEFTDGTTGSQTAVSGGGPGWATFGVRRSTGTGPGAQVTIRYTAPNAAPIDITTTIY